MDRYSIALGKKPPKKEEPVPFSNCVDSKYGCVFDDADISYRFTPDMIEALRVTNSNRDIEHMVSQMALQQAEYQSRRAREKMAMDVAYAQSRNGFGDL